ncbi:hypothetical protein OA43_01865 [Klebsiella variicola]|nr:hypothetical protein OA43_01865 [Klebsiella variicola]
MNPLILSGFYFTIGNYNPVYKVLRIDLYRLCIANCHSPLWIYILLIENVSGQRSDFVKDWSFIQRQFVT